MEEDNQVLWICPVCSAQNTELRPCGECQFSGVGSKHWQVSRAERDAAVKGIHRTWAGWIAFIGIALTLLWLFVDGGYERHIAATPEPPPAPKAVHADTSQAVESVRRFVSTDYPEWTLSGSTLNPTDLPDLAPLRFDIHLTKGDESKVVTVMVEEFAKSDTGEKYWQTFRAPPEQTNADN